MQGNPTDLFDPSHPFHGLGAGLAQMQQRRQAEDAKRQMMSQALMASHPNMAANAPGPGFQAPGMPGGGAPSLGGFGAGMTDMARAYAQSQQGTYSPKIGGIAQPESTGGLGGLFGGGGMKAGVQGPQQ